jgi:hypothetical protein
MPPQAELHQAPDTLVLGPAGRKLLQEDVKVATWAAGPWSPLPSDLKAGPLRWSLSGLRQVRPCMQCEHLSLRVSVFLGHASATSVSFTRRNRTRTPGQSDIYHWYHLRWHSSLTRQTNIRTEVICTSNYYYYYISSKSTLQCTWWQPFSFDWPLMKLIINPTTNFRFIWPSKMCLFHTCTKLVAHI